MTVRIKSAQGYKRTSEWWTGRGRASSSVRPGFIPERITAHDPEFAGLALKRLAHMDELKRTGRWVRFFQTEEAFEQALRNAMTDADRWKEIAYRATRPAGDAAE